MIQYFVILLDDTSTSYCHYQNRKKEHKLISIDDLKAGIFFAMKENLMVQYVLPDYELPIEYKEVMNSIDSHIFVPSICEDKNAIEVADVIVFNEWSLLTNWNFDNSQTCVIRTSKEEYFNSYLALMLVLEKTSRVNIIFTDVDTFTDADFQKYNQTLDTLSLTITKEYAKGHSVQFNLLTDRMMLKEMNNCGAGDTNITLAPDGRFYICPAFYYDGVCDGKEMSLGDVCQKGYAIGSVKDGLDIKNPQLYKLDYAPLCRSCDAYHCKRCIWLNRRTTLEVNTPSHEQCVMAHIERNVARQLLADIRTLGTFIPENNIKEINYLDPFDVRKEW
ncbi:CXXX repeat peptide maturase [Sodaliphilus sp.]|uniref:CXXX repeat peptide maturase n=1 Tax=Sodaliphilus sp. TaxID=2815818 RepID=UPI00388D8F3A